MTQATPVDSTFIRDMLDEFGMSQHQLAGRLGTSEAAVSRWIAGNRDPLPLYAAKLRRFRRDERNRRRKAREHQQRQQQPLRSQQAG